MTQEHITYGFSSTPFGEVIAGVAGQRLCWLAFVMEDGRAQAIRALQKRFRGVPVVHNDAVVRDWQSLPLDLQGTSFQKQVWKALEAIPEGKTVTYRDIAAKIGRPKAFRAVGSAIGANPVSLRIPCHRVIRSDGGLGGYAWGLARKEQILAAERAV